MVNYIMHGSMNKHFLLLLKKSTNYFLVCYFVGRFVILKLLRRADIKHFHGLDT